MITVAVRRCTVGHGHALRCLIVVPLHCSRVDICRVSAAAAAAVAIFDRRGLLARQTRLSVRRPDNDKERASAVLSVATDRRARDLGRRVFTARRPARIAGSGTFRTTLLCPALRRFVCRMQSSAGRSVVT